MNAASYCSYSNNFIEKPRHRVEFYYTEFSDIRSKLNSALVS